MATTSIVITARRPTVQIDFVTIGCLRALVRYQLDYQPFLLNGDTVLQPTASRNIRPVVQRQITYFWETKPEDWYYYFSLSSFTQF